MSEVVDQVRAAFADDARPDDGALLHPECRDDMDLQALYGFDHWSNVAGDEVVAEYAALAFLTAEGFRHFIPAFLIWVLQHPDSGEAVVDSTVWAFLPDLHDDRLSRFVRSKWAASTAEQRAAVTAFLEEMVDHHPDAGRALLAWSNDPPDEDDGARGGGSPPV